MFIDFSKYFHSSSKDLSGHGTVHIPKKHTDWPKEWNTIFYKVYKRLRCIQLPLVTKDTELFSLIQNRRSGRDFNTLSITEEEIGLILKYSCGEFKNKEGGISRAQPSGGARFPLETYLLVLRPSGNLAAGLYHYNISTHTLSVLCIKDFLKEDLMNMFTYQWVQNAAMVVLFTSVFERTQAKYGERGYRYVLLEAGHVGQNLYLVSGALGIKCCAMGGSVDFAIENLLQIDGVTESLVYSLVLGK